MSPPASPRRRADAEANRDALLRAAGALYAERGVDVPYDEIAQAAGVGRATLYRHFPTRERLSTGVLERVVEQVEAAAASLDPGPDAFLALFEATLRVHVDNLPLADLLPPRDERRAELDDLRARITDAFRAPLAAAQDAGRVRADLGVEDVRVQLLMLGAIMRPDVTREERRRAWRLAHAALGAAPPAD